MHSDATGAAAAAISFRHHDFAQRQRREGSPDGLDGSMTFKWPARLWLLLVIVPVAAGWAVVQWQRRRYANRFASPALIGAVAPNRPGRWRYAMAGALAVGLAVSVLGFAGPSLRRKVPRETATIVLAIDVSDSMAATDVR